jgi:hypothetical protein
MVVVVFVVDIRIIIVIVIVIVINTVIILVRFFFVACAFLQQAPAYTADAPTSGLALAWENEAIGAIDVQESSGLSGGAAFGIALLVLVVRACVRASCVHMRVHVCAVVCGRACACARLCAHVCVRLQCGVNHHPAESTRAHTHAHTQLQQTNDDPKTGSRRHRRGAVLLRVQEEPGQEVRPRQRRRRLARGCGALASLVKLFGSSWLRREHCCCC